MSDNPPEATQKMFFREAVAKAVREEMERNSRVMVLGQDVGSLAARTGSSTGFLPNLARLGCVIRRWQRTPASA